MCKKFKINGQTWFVNIGPPPLINVKKTALFTNEGFPNKDKTSSRKHSQIGIMYVRMEES